MIYRNPKLLRLASKCPRCLLCQKFNDGDVVAAHSNQLRDGKGMGTKAHDYRIAYVCYTCHMEIDQGKEWSKEFRRSQWEKAHRATIGWLFENGHLQVKD